jgi:hypothetical protein
MRKMVKRYEERRVRRWEEDHEEGQKKMGRE